MFASGITEANSLYVPGLRLEAVADLDVFISREELDELEGKRDTSRLLVLRKAIIRDADLTDDFPAPVLPMTLVYRKQLSDADGRRREDLIKTLTQLRYRLALLRRSGVILRPRRARESRCQTQSNCRTQSSCQTRSS